jgi:hypothetical protein
MAKYDNEKAEDDNKEADESEEMGINLLHDICCEPFHNKTSSAKAKCGRSA